MLILLTVLICLVGCGDENNYFDITKASKSKGAHSSTVKITTSRFVNGQLRVKGTCNREGEVLLILPVDEEDYKIIGSPKCERGKYSLISSNFNRPPCEIIVEYGQGKVAKAKVQGTDIYCH